LYIVVTFVSVSQSVSLGVEQEINI